MKKNKIAIFCLSVVTVLACTGGLTSCDSGSNSTISSSVASSSSSSSSSSISVVPPDGYYSKWTEEQQALMKKYCGEVLPYPEGLVSGDIEFEEVTGTDWSTYTDYAYLQITNKASSFTFQDYYKITDYFGWNTIKTYNGDAIQSSGDGFNFVEITKGSTLDKTKGYDVVYYYSPEVVDTEGNVTSEGTNILKCYADLTSSTTKATGFTDENLEIMDYVLTTTDIPFVKLGSVNQIGYTNANTFAMVDSYVKDLSKENADTLINSGFTLDEKLSKEYEMHVLTKTLADGATLQARLYYYQGNNTYIYYLPKETTTSTWPTVVTNEIKSLTGVDIPHFNIAEGGSYIYYKKHDSYYIYTLDLDSEYDYDMYNETELQNPKFTWNENLKLSSANYVDDDYVPIGFLIEAEITTPTSTFVSGWPTDIVNSTITSTFGISGISLPTLESSELPYSDMKMKYNYYGEDDYYEDELSNVTSWPEDYGLDLDATTEEIEAKAHELAKKDAHLEIAIYDKDFQARNAYESKLLNDLCWYVDYDEYDNTYYEDPEGKIKVMFSGYGEANFDYEGTTYISIYQGSGNQHEPEFYFDNEEMEIGQGLKEQLPLTKSMLPYKVTYTSNNDGFVIEVDENGNCWVTVDESVAEGTTATITASIQVPGESEPRTTTCTVTATKVYHYTGKDVIDEISKTLTDAGQTVSVNHPTDEEKDEGARDSLTCVLDETKTSFGSNKADLEAWIEEHLVPTQFEKLDPEWYDYKDTDEDTLVVDGQKVAASEIGYSFTDEDETRGLTIIKYWIYEDDGNTVLYVESW